jgi:hypothetical protein
LKTSSFPCSLWVVLFAVYYLSLCQSIDAQTLEDLLGKAKEDIEKAQQSGVPLGTVSILSNSSHIDSAGILYVVGEVYNDMATNTANNVEVIATFYDSSDKVVGANSTFTKPISIASGEKAPFDLRLSSASIPVLKIDHYDLKVDWK